jgi:hypothetical protein
MTTNHIEPVGTHRHTDDFHDHAGAGRPGTRPLGTPVSARNRTNTVRNPSGVTPTAFSQTQDASEVSTAVVVEPAQENSGGSSGSASQQHPLGATAYLAAVQSAGSATGWTVPPAAATDSVPQNNAPAYGSETTVSTEWRTQREQIFSDIRAAYQ